MRQPTLLDKLAAKLPIIKEQTQESEFLPFLRHMKKIRLLQTKIKISAGDQREWLTQRQRGNNFFDGDKKLSEVYNELVTQLLALYKEGSQFDAKTTSFFKTTFFNLMNTQEKLLRKKSSDHLTEKDRETYCKAVLDVMDSPFLKGSGSLVSAIKRTLKDEHDEFKNNTLNLMPGMLFKRVKNPVANIIEGVKNYNPFFSNST